MIFASPGIDNEEETHCSAAETALIITSLMALLGSIAYSVLSVSG